MGYYLRQDREEDQAFNSLSDEERERYFEEYHKNGGDPTAALNVVLGNDWFDENGDPKGSRYKSKK